MYGFYWATLYVFGEKKMYIILSCLGPGGARASSASMARRLWGSAVTALAGPGGTRPTNDFGCILR